MFIRVLLIFITVLYLNIAVGSEPKNAIPDLNGKRELEYKILQKSISKSDYNKFEVIYIDYPSINSNNAGIATGLLNDFMYKKAFLEISTQEFKFEFLPFAYELLAQTLGKNYPNNYAYYSTNMGVPTIQDIVPKILFVSGDILCYQVQYKFYFEPSPDYKLDGASFVKTYYLQLSTGKEIKLLSMLDPKQKAYFLSYLNNELTEVLSKNADYIKGYTWSNSALFGYPDNDYESEEYESEEEPTQEVKLQKEIPQKPLLSEKDLNVMFLQLTPFAASWILPPFCSSFDEAKQLGLVLNMPIDVFAKVVSPNSLMGNWFSQKQVNKPLTSINIYEKQQHFSNDINPLNHSSAFVKRVSKGVKKQSVYSVQISAKDTNYVHVRSAYFDTNARLTKLTFGEVNETENWLYFEYDSVGNLSTEIRYAYQQIEEQKQYYYSKQNCLERMVTNNSSDLPAVTQFFYRDSFVYEYPLFPLYSEADNLQSLNVTVHALDTRGNVKHSYGLNQKPSHVNRYSGDKILASFSYQYPNLDNMIYAYNKDGLVETILSDNGRRMHTFVYDNKLLKSYTHYDTYRVENQYFYEYDDKNNLLKYREKGRYGNDDRSYILRYEFYE
ncbi:MAG: hypothetical protein MH472_05610 [Bacteroidia bacterium]|nr:hypothetical protein [Bacteroidia bacterium]